MKPFWLWSRIPWFLWYPCKFTGHVSVFPLVFRRAEYRAKFRAKFRCLCGSHLGGWF